MEIHLLAPALEHIEAQFEKHCARVQWRLGRAGEPPSPYPERPRAGKDNGGAFGSGLVEHATKRWASVPLELERPDLHPLEHMSW